MLRLKKILFITTLAVLAEIACSAQVTPAQSDTTKINQKGKVSSAAARNQDQHNNQGSSQTSKAGSNPNKPVKQIRGARPDMSKVSGARPHITRPAGSGIPKGVGRPWGIIKPGGK